MRCENREGALRFSGSVVKELASFLAQYDFIVNAPQVYIIAAWTCARELFAELLWPRTHRQCVDALLESHFMKSRAVR